MSFLVGANVNYSINSQTKFNQNQKSINNQTAEKNSLFNAENSDSVNFTYKATNPIKDTTTKATEEKPEVNIAKENIKNESSVENCAVIAEVDTATENAATVAYNFNFGSLTHASSNYSSPSASTNSSTTSAV